mgnify:CR=1 FL=1
MDNISSLFTWIFIGDFGLLTMTPRYLFLVLFPIMIFLGIFGQILPHIPFLRKTGPFTNQFFYGFVGLGCTTAALASLDYIRDRSMRSRMVWILVLLIPCSSQLAIIASFAALVTLRVFLVYLFFFIFFSAVLYSLISRFYPLNEGMVKMESSETGLRLFAVIRSAFRSVLETAPAFCAGSVVISIAMYFGVLDWLCGIFSPLMERFLHLPAEATELFILNILKRDFGSASLLSLAGKGAFDGFQMITILTMLTFSVPCFNSTILLFRQQKLPDACFIWLGSFLASLSVGKAVSSIFFIIG